MPKQKMEIQYSVGIEDLYICFMDGAEPSTTFPTYEAIIYQQTNISDLTISATSSNFVKWASNKKIINITKNTSFGLAFNLAGLNREVKDKMFGVTRTKGISFEKAVVKEYPKFAVGVVFPLNDGTKVVRWYPRCTIAPAQETWRTQNDEMTVDDIAYTITADPLLFNDNTVVDFDSGSATAAGVTVEEFLNQVVCDESQIETLFPTTGTATTTGTTGTSEVTETTEG